MVAKIVSGKSIRGILHYNEDKVAEGKAKVVLASGFATDIDRLNFHQKLYRFEQLTRLNERSRTNALHLSLNFHADDRLAPEKLQQIAASYMERIGFGEQPYIAYEHLDTDHPHLHIATVTIDRKGKRKDIHDIGRRLSEPARKALEKEFGLVEAQGRRFSQMPYLRRAEYGSCPTKKQLANITGAVMRDYAYSSFAEYKAVLSVFGVHAERGAPDSRMFEKQGLLYAIMDKEGRPVGVPFKASSFHQGATMKNLERHFERNESRRRAHRADLKLRIDGVLDRFSAISRETLLRELAREQVALVLRRNETGLFYGLTFIDLRHRTVFNGSDLGRGYSARAITQRFSERDEPKRYLQQSPKACLPEGEKRIDTGDMKVERTLLDGLLEKADHDDPTYLGRRRRRRPGEEQSQGT